MNLYQQEVFVNKIDLQKLFCCIDDATIVYHIILSFNIVQMKSKNPFFQKLAKITEGINDFDELESDDKKYFVSGQTHKILFPEHYQFIGHSVEFFAVQPDDEGLVMSAMIYIDGDILETIKKEFGDPDLSIDLDSDVEFEDNKGQTEKLSYKSQIWIRDMHRLRYALFPVERKLKSQIYIV